MKNKKVTHTSATSRHYDKEAESYDAFNDENSRYINETILSLLNKYKVKSILDFSTGTGSQPFYLRKHGFETVGVDINDKMLKLAKSKLKKSHKNVCFLKGDMRTKKVGKFDAVLTIFNSIGHLTRSDFVKAIRNISDNLNPGGIYIFDIFNLDYLLHKDNITKLTIDWQKKKANTIWREIQYSTITQDGILASYDIYHEQVGEGYPKVSQASQTLQVYSKADLRTLLNKEGFKVLKQCNIDGTPCYKNTTERILTVAKK